MKPTPGNWTYNEDFAEVHALVGTKILAALDPRGETESVEETNANGYLMAAAPELRDELTNLSQAVAAYFNVDINDDDMKAYCQDRMETMLHRAENALSHIFPPEQQP